MTESWDIDFPVDILRTEILGLAPLKKISFGIKVYLRWLYLDHSIGDEAGQTQGNGQDANTENKRPSALCWHPLVMTIHDA